jgi:hypothetical protein
MNIYVVDWKYCSTTLDLGTIRSLVVNFTLIYPGTHGIGDLVVPESVWRVLRREKSYPCRDSNPTHPVRRYTD